MLISLCLILLLPQADTSATAVVESWVNTFQSTVCFSTASNGKLFVVDQKSQSVQQVTQDGKIEKTIGGKGWGDYEFDGPTDVSSSFLLDVFVADHNNRRIQRYDYRLNYVQTIDQNSFSSDVGGFYPKACALSSLGDLFVIELDGKRILKLSKRYQLEREFGTYKDGVGALSEPKDIAISASDEIFVLDGAKIIVYDSFGNYLRAIKLPEGEWKSVQASGNIVIATASRLIAVFSLDGSEQKIFKRDSIVGIEPADEFIDSSIFDRKLIILTPSTLYFCSLQ